MAHPITEMFIKQPILKMLNEPCFAEIFTPAKDNNPREYQLEALGKKFRADFAYKISGKGWLFIEDDSEKTCLSNLLKYSAWLEENPTRESVYIVHIVSPEDSGWIRLCEHYSKKITGFIYIMIKTNDWADSLWLKELQINLNRIKKMAN